MDGHPEYPFPGYPYPGFPGPGRYDDFDDGCEPCPDCGGHIPVTDDDGGDEGFRWGRPGMGSFDPYGGGGYGGHGYGGGYPGMDGMGRWFS
jgi:hypothetical protein